jgi:hypothetical protein
MNTEQFKVAVATAAVRPRAVAVSPQLFLLLVAEGSIKHNIATPSGIPAPAFGIELPFYDDNIFVSCDPRLEDSDSDYIIPPPTGGEENA